MTKTDLAKEIYSKHGGLTLKQSKDIVNLLFDLISKSLKTENHLVISNFGTFIVVKRKMKLGRIISEGKTLLIPEHKSVVFIPSKKREKMS